jgi:hypothetical protein
VRSIAEAHHGEVSFESTPGKGTTFWFTVPLAGLPGGVPTDWASSGTSTPTPAEVPKHRGSSAEARR